MAQTWVVGHAFEPVVHFNLALSLVSVKAITRQIDNVVIEHAFM
jgi:hypothetical protein